MYPDSVWRAVTLERSPTPPLADFARAYLDDDNVFWRLSTGHHQNLLEEALELLHEHGWRP